MRLFGGLLGAVLALVVGTAPAVSALETTTFGIDVAVEDPEGRLHVPIAAGDTSSGELRVWNKTAEPLVLRLSVVPAQVDEHGNASFGGDAAAVGWVSVDPMRVTLGPQEQRRVAVVVDAPRKLDGERKTVAVLAEPESSEDAPAVLQRLAVTTYLDPDDGSLVASLGLLPWIAAVALVVAALAAHRVLGAGRGGR